MKTKASLVIIASIFVLPIVAGAQTTVLSENFDTYVAGNLSGQGTWLPTASAATPIQVAGAGADKFVTMGTSGQDDYNGFSSLVTKVDGGSLTYSFEATLSAAQANGDYFAHVSNPLGTTANFYGRLFARSSGAGFQFGLQSFSGTGSAVTYGTGVLSLNQAYNVAVTWNFVAGATNDTFALTVDGAAYSTALWLTASAEPTALAAFNLRQGTAGNAATISNLDDVLVTAIPEPSSAIALFGGLGMLLGFRRMRSRLA